MTRQCTTWYKCLFCTRVYPKSHQLVEHRKLNHAEEWKQRKLAKKLEALKSNGFNGEISAEENEWSSKDAEKMEIEITSVSPSPSIVENEINSDDTGSTSTVCLNESEVESEYSNDDNNDNLDQSNDQDCKIVYKNNIQKTLEVKLTKLCDRDLIRIKKEEDLLERPDDSDFDNSTDIFVPDVVRMSGCLEEPINPSSPSNRTERIFKLYKCDQCTKQFLHKWGLRFHRESHMKNSRKKI